MVQKNAILSGKNTLKQIKTLSLTVFLNKVDIWNIYDTTF